MKAIKYYFQHFVNWQRGLFIQKGDLLGEKVLKQGNKLTVLRSPVSSQSMFRLNAKDARALKKE